MIDVKLSVTIELQGNTMMTPQECGENPENYDRNWMLLFVRTFDKKTKNKFYSNCTFFAQHFNFLSF